jgi:predicted ATPase
MGLPASGDAFFDRFDEQRRLAAWLAGMTRDRVMSIVGPSGCGKTRLCEEVCAVSVGWPGGIIWVDVSGCGTASALGARVAWALGPLTTTEPTAHFTERPRCLLVLDGFEAEQPVGGLTVGRWLAAARSLAVLVTAARPLGVEDERVLPLGPLPETSAISLFRSRARSVGAAPAAESTDRRDVRLLVRAVGHLPLAMELLAGWADRVSPVDMLASLRGARVRRGADPLDRAASWVWGLLARDAQKLLSGCSVFESAFGADDARAVVASAAQDGEVDGVLAELVDRGVLEGRTWRGDGVFRLRMHPFLRAFAGHHLADAEGVRERLRQHRRAHPGRALALPPMGTPPHGAA